MAHCDHNPITNIIFNNLLSHLGIGKIKEERYLNNNKL